MYKLYFESSWVNLLRILIRCHPCGSYNQDTLEILKNLGIELGFKQMMFIEPEKGMKKINNSPLEIARVSHSLVMKASINENYTNHF